MPDGFSDFLRDIERTGDQYRTDCAITLLELSSSGRKEFMNMVSQTKQRSVHDKGLHSLSLVLKGGKRGLSFLSVSSNLDKAELFKQAAAFAIMKKYDARCDEWVGFGWDVASSRAVDVAFLVSEPWAHDAQVERLVKDTLRPGHRAGI